MGRESRTRERTAAGHMASAIGTLGTWYSEQSELAEAATSPHARNRSDSIYITS
jgi:hypothetical protein